MSQHQQKQFQQIQHQHVLRKNDNRFEFGNLHVGGRGFSFSSSPAQPIIRPDPVDFTPLIKEMWVSGKFSDLTIIVDENEFKVHKNILGARSAVFSQIFEDQNDATEIKIPDFSSKSVEALLKFLYTNEAPEDENAKENLNIADKFKVATMKSFYERIICNQLNDSNALETFLFAHKFSSEIMKKKAFKKIVDKVPDEVPEKLMEDPEKLKKLLDHRRAYEEILADESEDDDESDESDE